MDYKTTADTVQPPRAQNWKKKSNAKDFTVTDTENMHGKQRIRRSVVSQQLRGYGLLTICSHTRPGPITTVPMTATLTNKRK
jgi:hypothetical protein